MSVQLDTLSEPVIDTAASGGLLRDTLRNVLRQRSAIIGIVLLSFLILTAVFADQISSFDPNQVLIGIETGAVRRAPPCIHILGCPATTPEHLMGLDGNVRDEFSRVVHGARISL